MADAVLLEWEGVLADTGVPRRAALLRALEEERLTLPLSLYDPSWNMIGIRDAAAAALATLQVDDPTLADLVAMRASRAYATRLGMGVTLQPGAHAFVDAVRQRVPLAIVTRASRPETELLLRLADLEDAARVVVCADDLADGAAEASIERALVQLARLRALRRERVILVSGARDALRAARRLGIRSVAIGVAAHIALEADGVVEHVNGLTIAELGAAAGLPPMERSP